MELMIRVLRATLVVFGAMMGMFFLSLLTGEVADQSTLAILGAFFGGFLLYEALPRRKTGEL